MGMPSLRRGLTAAQVNAIREYVLTRSAALAEKK